jgi:hypothetical protein
MEVNSIQTLFSKITKQLAKAAFKDPALPVLKAAVRKS